MKVRTGTALVIATAVVVTAVVITAMVIVGSPATERQRRLDAARVQDLETIERLVDGFARVHGSPPADVDTLAHEPGYAVPRNDPESGIPYGYEKLSANSFRLCAIFTTDSADAGNSGSYPLALNATWAHGRGRQCFERRAQGSLR